MDKIKVPGYILMESVFAMIVVMTCFGAGVMIYDNVVAGTRSPVRVRAHLQLFAEAGKMKEQRQFHDETIHFDGFNVTRKAVKYKDADDLVQLQLVAITPDGTKLDEYDEIVRTQ